MSNYFDSKYYATLSWKSRQLLQELITLRQKKIEVESKYTFPTFDVLAYRTQIVKQKSAIYLRYFEDSIKEAITKTEYSRNAKFLENIQTRIALFLSEILQGLATGYKIGAIKAMKEWAGDMRDFIHGVDIARANLGIDMTHPKDERAAFWKKYIWPNDTLYDSTIKARLDAWGEYTPYWELIENGNEGRDLAYPQFPKTDFFSNAIERIEEDLTAEVGYRREKGTQGKDDAELVQKELTIIEQAQKQLLDNPDYYKPGWVLAEFDAIETQRTYQIYVTQKRGQVGVKIKR
jgi:hypothetical protein